MIQTDPTLALLREHVPDILIGTVFSFLGLAACGIAAIRRSAAFRVLLWSGMFIGMYGIRLLAQATDDLGLAPVSPWPHRLDVFVTYFLLVPGILFWVELSLGWVRRFLQALTFLSCVVGVAGLGYFATSGSPDRLLPLNALLAIFLLVAAGVVTGVPRLYREYFVVQSRVFAVCVPAIAAVSLYYNGSRIIGFQPSHNIEPAVYVLWMFALGYVAAQRVFANERRLLAIENELETARQIQFSILPDSPPTVANLLVAAAYNPMSAVAGDFYQFIQPDERHLGVLLADVSGHGIPAALISSMIKVAMQSVAASACNPAEVLQSLNRILSPELRGQLISAAYLWLDTEKQCARYSAAGHPPLLCWRNARAEMERIESNGLLLGISRDSLYPVCSIPLDPHDRFLMYTDGMVEPESAGGESFGEHQLEQVVRGQRSQPAPALLQRMLSELRDWQPRSATQQDDITLIVIDVV